MRLSCLAQLFLYGVTSVFRLCNKRSNTDMTAIATNIEINIKQLMFMTDVPGPRRADQFYLN